MTNLDFEGNYYTINHLTLFTGLSDRTIRNYISMGVLEGEKINGMWHFTHEQTEAFIKHLAVRPSILAKNNALVYDFLIDNRKESHQSCIILDMPNDDQKAVSEYFCYAISNGDYKNINFAFDSVSITPRVILKGSTADVMKLVNQYYKNRT